MSQITKPTRARRFGMLLGLLAAVAAGPVAAYFTDVQPLGTRSHGTQDFRYGGHITWSAQVDLATNDETFRTETHDNGLCGWDSCAFGGSSAQVHCTRTAGLGTYGNSHKVKSTLLKNGEDVSRQTFIHEHPAGDINYSHAEKHSLANISIYPSGTVEWKFRVAWYNSNGAWEVERVEPLS